MNMSVVPFRRHDGYREQVDRVDLVHDVVDAEFGARAHWDLAGRKGPRKVARRGELPRVGGVREAKLGHGGDLVGLVLRGGAGLPGDEDFLAAAGVVGLQGAHDPVDAVPVDLEVVVVPKRLDPLADVCLDEFDPRVELLDQDRVTHRAQEDGVVPVHPRPLELDRVLALGLGDEPGVGDSDRPAVVQLFVGRAVEVKGPAGAVEDVRPGLFVEEVRRDRQGRTFGFRVERVDVERIPPDDGQGLSRLRDRALGAALHDLAHGVRDPEVFEAPEQAERRVRGRVVRPPSDDDVKVGGLLHGLQVRLEAHLRDDARAAVDVVLGQVGHPAAAGVDLPGLELPVDEVLGDLRVDLDDLQRPVPVLLHGLGDDLGRLVDVRVLTVASDRSDQRRDVVEVCGFCKQLQILRKSAVGNVGKSQRQTSRSAVGRTSICDDGVTASFDRVPEDFFVEPLAQLADGGEDFELVFELG